jgi:hypothetical protein
MWTKIGPALFFFTRILVLPANAAQSAPDSPTTAQVQQPTVVDPVVLKKGTSVFVGNIEEVSSKAAKPGERVRFKVLADVRVDGKVVIAKGSEALGTVNEVTAPQRRGRSARMAVSVDATSSVTGEDIPLRESSQLKGPNEVGNVVGEMVQSVAGIYFLPVTPLLLLMHGGEIVMPKATRVIAVVDKDASFDSAAVARMQPVRPPGPAPSGYAFVYLYRRKDGKPSGPAVYCGKARIGQTEPGKYFRIQLPPGRYRFHSHLDSGFEMELLEGEEYYIRGLSEQETPPSNSLLSVRRTFHLVPALQGEYELLAADLEPGDPKHVKDVSKIDPRKLQDLRN